MNIKEVLEFLFQRADATQAFWNLYIGAVTTTLGLLTAAKVEWFRREVCIALTFVFAVFALSNLSSLDAVRRQRDGLVKVATSAPGFREDLYRPILNSVSPPDKIALRVFHSIFDLFVITAIWLVPLLRRRGRQPTHS
jgi:hypothetical protein